MQLTEQARQALGFDTQRLQPCPRQPQFLLHGDVLSDWHLLTVEAEKAGFNLAIASSFRSFERQAAIWNAKANGERLLLDTAGQVLDYTTLTAGQLLDAILRWSAVPGFSRHHWGCDMDVFDANAMVASDVRLVPAEVDAGGPCAALHDWLDARIAANESFGFFRPYTNNACKVSEEKWHLSYLPVAAGYEKQLYPALAVAAWRQHSICLLTELEQSVEMIYNDYVCLNYDRLPSWVGNYVVKGIK